MRLRLPRITPARIVSVAIVALLAGSALIVHFQSLHRYDSMITELRAAGRPTTLAELRSLSPIVDAAMQRRFEDWAAGMALSSDWRAEWRVDADVQEWLAGRHEQVPTSIRRSCETNAAAMARLETLLASGAIVDAFADGRSAPLAWNRPVYLRACGWMSPLDAMKNCDERQLVCRSAARWLRCRALCEADPLATLRSLDRLSACCAHPNSPLDAGIGMAVEQLRDDACFEASYRTAIPDAEVDRWLASSPDFFQRAADGWRGERILVVEALADHLRAHPGDLGWHLGPNASWARLGSQALADVPLQWLLGVGEIGSIVRDCDAVEQRMRGTTTDISYLKRGRWDFHSSAWEMQLNLDELAQGLLQGATRQRLLRLAVRCLRLAALDGALPHDHDALVARLGSPAELDAGGNRLAIRYERLSDIRFRLAVPADSSAPNFAHRIRFARWTRLGMPPKSITPKDGEPYTPLLVIDPFMLEITLPDHHPMASRH
jgi:hypothetical protein